MAQQYHIYSYLTVSFFGELMMDVAHLINFARATQVEREMKYFKLLLYIVMITGHKSKYLYRVSQKKRPFVFKGS